MNDPIAIRHPKLPGFVKTIERRSFPARERNGWVEAKSPAAKAAVEKKASPRGDLPTPSKENKS